MSAESDSRGVFINGREQVIELLRTLPENEREKLLKNMRMRNPQKTDELSLHAVNFDDLFKLEGTALESFLSVIKAPLIGLALKTCPVQKQRLLLSRLPKAYAQEAFRIMQAQLSDPLGKSDRAKERVKETLVMLRKRQLI